ncbi:hypothetical protein [Wolbachia endosymbiont (group A) of Conops quadrifasciatus]|uniref:hypothetical protein n=1 Tax=Wolbachia endosymbiont (group A) of Conops quadrifasciatus TaxID=3066143 RepID=UPI003132F915
MPASLKFKQVDGQTDAANTGEIKTIVYEDAAQNKYTFGVDNNTDVFSTFKYQSHNGNEIDYSPLAVEFMTNGAVAKLLGKLTATPDTLGADVTVIKGAVSKPNLEDKLKSIQD